LNAAAVIAELTAGRLSVVAAADQLRQQLDSGAVSMESVQELLRAPLAEATLAASTVETLLSALAPQTLRRAAPTMLRTAEQEATRMRPELAVAAGARQSPPDQGLTVLKPAAAPVADRGPATPADEIAPGAVIKGQFELTALIGRGGMGMVFSALDRLRVEARDPNPEVALKILKHELQRRADAFVLLQREASKAQMLAHPNVATVYNFDRDGATFFITMELLRGQSLEALLREARGRGIGRKLALPLLRGMAEGLAYAHRKGIVHSDLKPGNVFVITDGTAKILDFGIARAIPSASRSGPEDQFDAGALGAYTEAYATAEMIHGGAPSPADDLYALGVIAYELLSGRHPFGRKSALEAKERGLSPTPIRELRRSEWRTLARCLAFERAARPADAGAFLRLFFGATRLRNALVAATLLLSLMSAFLWYRNYQASGPSVPWEQLAAADRQQIEMDLAEGQKAWAFYREQHINNALNDALNYYADAYAHQKGNREAVRGLKRIADEVLRTARSDPGQLRESAQSLAGSSEFLASYPPVMEAMSH
jgi:serine/threonine protein kinase